MTTTPVFLLKNPMDRGVWGATDQGVTESDTTKHAHTQLMFIRLFSENYHEYFSENDLLIQD